MEPNVPPEPTPQEPEHVPNRAERRRIAKGKLKLGGKAPMRMDITRPGWSPHAYNAIDKVYVNDVWIENCVIYDQSIGFAQSRGGPRVYGVVKVTLK